MSHFIQWRRSTRCLANEDGTAIVTALLILMLLSLVAVTATDTTVNEKAMVRSEAVFEQNFSQAESSALEGLQKLASKGNDEIGNLLPKRLALGSDNKDLLLDSESEEVGDILKVIDTNNDSVVDKTDALEHSELNTNALRTAVMLPIAVGDSLSVTTAKSRLYRYNTFGLSDDLGGKALICIGYKRRIDN